MLLHQTIDETGKGAALASVFGTMESNVLFIFAGALLADDIRGDSFTDLQLPFGKHAAGE